MLKKRSFKVLFPLVVEIGYRREIELPEEVIRKRLSMQKSQSRKKEREGKEYLALLSTGAGSKPLPTGDALLISFIIVPSEVAEEIGISDYIDSPKIGEY